MAPSTSDDDDNDGEDDDDSDGTTRVLPSSDMLGSVCRFQQA